MIMIINMMIISPSWLAARDPGLKPVLASHPPCPPPFTSVGMPGLDSASARCTRSSPRLRPQRSSERWRIGQGGGRERGGRRRREEEERGERGHERRGGRGSKEESGSQGARVSAREGERRCKREREREREMSSHQTTATGT